jgi:site-specific recombinase XerD
MATRLKTVVAILSSGAETDPRRFPWHVVRFQHVSAVRAALLDKPPSTANLTISALRGVLRACWRLGQMSAEDYHRAVDVKPVKGSKLPRGRALEGGELRSLFRACAADQTAAGRRDAALLAILYGCGARRSELAALDLADYNPATGELKILEAKGGKDRLVYCTNGSRDALQAWLAVRGAEPGPLFYPVNKAGRILCQRKDGQPWRMTDQSIYNAIQKRADEAEVKHLSPHDLRRSFVGDMLEAGADLHQVQQLAGHASVSTTLRYDRRPETAKRKAAELLHVPFMG